MDTNSYLIQTLLRNEIMIPENYRSNNLFSLNLNPDLDSPAVVCTCDPNRAFRKLEASLRLEQHKVEDFIKELKALIYEDAFLATVMIPIKVVTENDNESGKSAFQSRFQYLIHKIISDRRIVNHINLF